MPAVISDTSCLIFLSKIGQLGWLPALFEEIWVTPTIAAEYGQPLPAWVIIQHHASLPTPTQVPERFGAGERSAIGLALGQVDCLLIMDDEVPKRFAKTLSITCIGTLGIARLAKEAALIAQVRPWVEKLRTVGGMWLTDAVAERVCREAGE